MRASLLSLVIILLLAPTASYAIGIEVRDSQGSLIGSQGETKRGNIFEVGAWALPVVLTNAVFFCIFFLYRKSPVNGYLRTLCQTITEFDVSKRVSFGIVSVILGIFVLFTISDVFVEETSSDYLSYVKPNVEDWNWLQKGDILIKAVKFTLASSSLEYLGNMKIPFYFASIALLIMTYLFTREIARKRTAGILAMVILLQSTIFVRYSTSATYDNLWFLIYLVSLYLVYKKWYLSPVSYVISILAKPLPSVFVLMSLFFVYASNLSRKRKVFLGSVFGALLVAIVILILSGAIVPNLITFNLDDLGDGLNQLPILLRFDGPLYLAALMPMMVLLFMRSKFGINHATSIAFFLLNMLSIPFLYAILTDAPYEPHNMIPLIVFFGIGGGILLSQGNNERQEPPQMVWTRNLVFVIALVMTAIALVSAIFPKLLSSITV